MLMKDTFFKGMGTEQVPVKEFGGYCGRKGRVQDSSVQDDSDGESTATGGGGTSVADSSQGPASSSQGPAVAGRRLNLPPIDESQCMHRAFYHSLYSAEAGTDEPPNGIEVMDV